MTEDDWIGRLYLNPEYVWIYDDRQDSEYASAFQYLSYNT